MTNSIPSCCPTLPICSATLVWLYAPSRPQSPTPRNSMDTFLLQWVGSMKIWGFVCATKLHIPGRTQSGQLQPSLWQISISFYFPPHFPERYAKAQPPHPGLASPPRSPSPNSSPTGSTTSNNSKCIITSYSPVHHIDTSRGIRSILSSKLGILISALPSLLFYLQLAGCVCLLKATLT